MAPASQLGQLAPILAEATAFQRERQWNEAAHKYTAALEQTAHLLPPGDLAELYNRRGLCCEKDGDLEQALDDYSEGIERGGAERHSLMYHRGRLYCQLQRWSEAEADLRVASSLQPAHEATAERLAEAVRALEAAAVTEAPPPPSPEPDPRPEPEAEPDPEPESIPEPEPQQQPSSKPQPWQPWQP